MNYYHYTVKSKLDSIIKDGFIRTTKVNLERREKPCVWVSNNDVWENTCSKMIRKMNGDFIGLKTLQEHCEWGLIPVRISIDTKLPLFNFNQFCLLSNVRKKVSRSLVKSSKLMGGNHNQWKVSFEPIHRDNWISIEYYDGKKWLVIEEDIKEVV